jgi:hypothetical protein
VDVPVLVEELVVELVVDDERLAEDVVDVVEVVDLEEVVEEVVVLAVVAKYTATPAITISTTMITAATALDIPRLRPKNIRCKDPTWSINPYGGA